MCFCYSTRSLRNTISQHSVHEFCMIVLFFELHLSNDGEFLLHSYRNSVTVDRKFLSETLLTLSDIFVQACALNFSQFLPWVQPCCVGWEARLDSAHPPRKRTGLTWYSFPQDGHFWFLSLGNGAFVSQQTDFWIERTGFANKSFNKNGGSGGGGQPDYF